MRYFDKLRAPSSTLHTFMPLLPVSYMLQKRLLIRKDSLDTQYYKSKKNFSLPSPVWAVEPLKFCSNLVVIPCIIGRKANGAVFLTATFLARNWLLPLFSIL